MNKSELRKIYLQKQKSLSETKRREKSRQVKEQFFANFDLENIRVLHLFVSIAAKGEIGTSFIFDELRQKFPQIKTVVPRVDFAGDHLVHLEFTAETELVTNHWGIKEPVGNAFVEEKEIDLVLVPMLCFDERGYRVGHGKGFYDKFLSRCRKDCLKIGLSMFEPIEEIEDINQFDVRLDHCITPHKVWDFK